MLKFHPRFQYFCIYFIRFLSINAFHIKTHDQSDPDLSFKDTTAVNREFNFTDNSNAVLSNLKGLFLSGNFSDIFESSFDAFEFGVNQHLNIKSNTNIALQETVSEQQNRKSTIQIPTNDINSFLFVSKPNNHTPENCYIIKVKESVGHAAFEKLLAIFRALGAKINKKYRHGFRGYSVCFQNGILPLSILREIPSIEYVERDNIISSSQIQEDAPWGLARLSSPQKKSSQFSFDSTGEGVTVYVIDSELAGRATLGYTAYPKLVNDCTGHGTEVSSIIAGTNAGVAKKAKIIAAQVLDCKGDGNISDLIDALSWIVKTHRKPAVINMSLGDVKSRSLEMAANAAVAAGITVVASAGNSNVNACTQSPGASKSVITVASSNRSNGRAYFSNFGSCVDIFAPGVDILSATLSRKSRNGWRIASGTSFSAPFVTGVVALLLEKNPYWSPSEIRRGIQKMGASFVLEEKSLKGSPNLLLQAPYVNSKLPILVKLSDPADLPINEYHFSSIVSGYLILVICSFICAALALMATAVIQFRRHLRRKDPSKATSISEDKLKHSILNSRRPSVFL